jgi:hypothetical protein
MGGQYALACAYKLADRVSSTAVMARAVPLDNPESFDALNKLDQLLTSFSEHSPKAAETIFFSIGNFWQSTLLKPGIWYYARLCRSILRRFPANLCLALPALLHLPCSMPRHLLKNIAHGQAMGLYLRANPLSSDGVARRCVQNSARALG